MAAGSRGGGRWEQHGAPLATCHGYGSTHDSLRRLTLRHHHRTMSTSWVALEDEVAR